VKDDATMKSGSGSSSLKNFALDSKPMTYFNLGVLSGTQFLNNKLETN